MDQYDIPPTPTITFGQNFKEQLTKCPPLTIYFVLVIISIIMSITHAVQKKKEDKDSNTATDIFIQIVMYALFTWFFFQKLQFLTVIGELPGHYYYCQL